MRKPRSCSYSFPTEFRIGWRNLGRNPKRTLLGVCAIAMAQAAMVWISSFIGGYATMVFDALTGPMMGHIQIHTQKYLDDRALERTIPQITQQLSEIKKLDRIQRAVARAYAPVLASLKDTGHTALVVGIEIQEELRSGGLLEGMDLRSMPGPHEILVGSDLANEIGIRPGDTLALMGQGVDGSIASGLYRVKGFVQTAVDSVNRSGILMALTEAQDFLAMPDQAHEILIRAKDRAQLDAVANELSHHPLFKNFETKTWHELVPLLATVLKLSDTANLIILILVFLTSAAGIANTMLMASFERTREFGMLLSLGCSPARIGRMLTCEALTLGLCGSLLGSLIGGALALYGQLRGLDILGLIGASQEISMAGMSLHGKIFLELQWGHILRGVIAVGITSLVASLWPASRIFKLQPVEAMKG